MGRLVPRGSQYSKQLDGPLGTMGQVQPCSTFVLFILLTTGSFTERPQWPAQLECYPLAGGAEGTLIISPTRVIHHENEAGLKNQKPLIK